MRYLNLSDGTDFIFEPSLECDIIRFPSGFETTLRLKEAPPKEVTIVARIENSSDIFIIAQAVDSLRRCGATEISLFLPFVPNARQDRSMIVGDSFSLKVFAQFINSLRFKKVTVFDAHSNVTGALIDNCVVLHSKLFAAPILSADDQDWILCSPDIGAAKKTQEVAEEVYHMWGDEGYPRVVLANKKRDPVSGNITDVEIYGSVDRQRVYILDDIADGCGTFVPLGKKLTSLGASEVNLIISHGIFSKGLSPLVEAGFKKIYTTNSLSQKQFDYFKDGNWSKNHPLTEITPKIIDLRMLVLKYLQ